jgi:hypothetical protein
MGVDISIGQINMLHVINISLFLLDPGTFPFSLVGLDR